MNDEVKYTYKEVTLTAGMTEKSRKKILDKKIEKMAKTGWEIESHIDGGMTKSSKATFKRDINYQAPKKQSSGIIKKVFKYILYISLGFILLGTIGSMLPKVELTPKQKEEIAIEKQENMKVQAEKERLKIIEHKKQLESTREYTNKILNVIYSDMARKEKHLQDFATTLSQNNLINILEQSKQYNYYAKKWAMQSYIKAEEWGSGAKEDELIEDIIDEVGSLARFHQIYYDSIDEYLDNQIPSKLLEIKQNMETINNYKNNVMIKAITLANKYSLTYNEKKNNWDESKE